MMIAPVPYPVELVELGAGDALDGWDGLTVSSLPLKHRIPCYGYRVRVARKPVFNPQKAEALGIPKPLYRTLHAGGGGDAAGTGGGSSRSRCSTARAGRFPSATAPTRCPSRRSPNSRGTRT